MALIKLISSDQQEFMVPEKVASCSVTIRNMLQLEIGEQAPDEGVPLVEVSSDVLREVLEFCEHHQDDKPFDRDAPIEMDDWDKEYLAKLDRVRLCALLKASNYMDVERLSAYLCKQFAGMLQGKTSMEIRNILGLTNVPTPDNSAAAE